MVGPITLLMLKHHEKINQILLDFEKVSNQDVKEFTKVFEQFKEKMEKHFFIEEMNIFPVSNKNNPTEVLRLKNLLKDHQDLREIVRNMEEDVAGETKPETKILRELLYAHEGREVQGFYPLLDMRLSEKDKSTLVNNINEEKF